MKTSKRAMLSPSMETRLTAYAAAGVAVAIPALAPTAKASIVYSSPTLNLAIPQNVDGVYLDLTTGATGTSAAAVPGFDINMYGSTTLTFYFGADVDINNGAVFSGATGTPANKYVVLQVGALVGPASTFSGATTAAYNSLFRAPGATGYLGMSFTNDNTGAVNYGYIHFKNAATTGTTGFPATILDYAYENTGAAITIAAVPEPTTNVALGLGALALGAVSVRRWRKDKQAVA